MGGKHVNTYLGKTSGDINMARMGRKVAIKLIFGTLIVLTQPVIFMNSAASQIISESIASLKSQAEKYTSDIASTSVSAGELDSFFDDFQGVISLNSEFYRDIEQQILVLRGNAENELQGLEGTAAGAGPRFREIQNLIMCLEQQRDNIGDASMRLQRLNEDTIERRREIQLLISVSMIDQVAEAL
jgi:hypothetical protein